MVVKDRQWLVKEKNDPFVVPSFETISFSMPSMKSWEDLLKGEQDGWVYLTDGNPTLAALETLLAKIQGVEKCWVTSTGKSALAACLLGLLKAGDNLILLQEGYKSTRLFAQGILQKLGVEVTLVKVDDLHRLNEIVEKKPTAVMVLEAPTNPMTRVPDLRKACAIAQEHGILTVLDNSLAGFHHHGDIPVDLIAHSLSKYASGVGDVMGGAILGSREMVSKVKNANVWNTDALSAHSAVEIWKGMQTYDLRIERQSSNAMKIAQFLEQHPKVKRVLYPGLESHPDHEIAKKQMKDFGSVLAFDTVDGTTMRKTLDNLEVFRIAFGTGFTQSIANPAWLFYARSFPEEQTGVSAILDSTIRLSVGIEPPEVLIADLEKALG
ncbi:MAG: PLP-dependent aspartate aminotransferase family protein [Candidatus Obscuribacterales bacterium]|jgi:cystathionine beta-lyase/cystathionine gamma-synthase|nr:PLP-dependent aspartate aminotransferase family protein [Candidatus Obscuribacterales bacterium]